MGIGGESSRHDRCPPWLRALEVNRPSIVYNFDCSTDKRTGNTFGRAKPMQVGEKA
jgi:hypothetical protein